MNFDNAAGEFQKGREIPDAAIPNILRSIAEMTSGERINLLFEIGVGTGKIGCRLRELSNQYIGIDTSSRRLAVFQKRGASSKRGFKLLLADGNEKWPLADHSADLIFSSRALHLLNRDHVASELLRVSGKSGAFLIIGRVKRAPDSVGSVLKREMRRLLRKHGVVPREGSRFAETLFSELREKGAIPLPPKRAAVWKKSHSPLLSLRGWEEKDGLAGLDLEDNLKETVLKELRNWARRRFKKLDQTIPSVERYALEGLRLPSPPRTP